MNTFRHAWSSLLSWVPPPLQVGIALVLAMLIITKLVPRLIRGGGMALRVLCEPSLELLTYPEFLVTTAARRAGWRIVPGPYAYGRTLGALATSGTRLGQWMANRFSGRKPRFPWKTALLVTALLVGCWYLTPKVPPGHVRTVMTDVNTDDVHVNTWLATGQWTAAAASTCATSPARPKPKKKITHRQRHHRQA